MDSGALDFLKSLSESFGPSGFEREPVSLVKSYVQRFADEITSDKLGSLHFSAKGKGPVVLLPGHVDEVGFVVSGINGHGFLTFNTIGGWFDQVLLGQRVKIRGTRGDRSGGHRGQAAPHPSAGGARQGGDQGEDVHRHRLLQREGGQGYGGAHRGPGRCPIPRSIR